MKLGKKMLKTIFDKTLVLFLIIIFSPIYIVVSLLILWKMGSPILFRQQRPGKDEKIFGIYKFRTMTNDTDADGNLLPDEQRLVGVGKFIRSTSLDELPQLFNVLKGEMSFVGPRPLLIEYLDLYNDKQKRRHEVKPGITGWAQVNGRNAISWEQKFDYDVWYVDNQSFWLDMKILWMTFLKVVKRSDISSSSSATMEKFKGSGE
ncbi:undecaprenyl phosphate N,N'-diacetylbacillosamine 1-phosphate transferase [Malaciobacter canalis]|uniref:undecaprenyl phosphate N,N'-diacetylbacillosamine 1-phosphate transferase n=1 Tax=Malaciobacter canalis TaxID=1912871 RepID=UPI00384E7453